MNSTDIQPCWLHSQCRFAFHSSWLSCPNHLLANHPRPVVIALLLPPFLLVTFPFVLGFACMSSWYTGSWLVTHSHVQLHLPITICGICGNRPLITDWQITIINCQLLVSLYCYSFPVPMARFHFSRASVITAELGASQFFLACRLAGMVP
jgi:hypothetical protein